MNNTENPSTSSWERIQAGVRETERLIGQKKYNMSMIKARQTLEFMVKIQCEKAGLEEGGLIDMIDALFDNGCISKTTNEHYHKIRTIGNKATHEEDNSAYNANQAHHFLSQEVYTFANDSGEKRRKPISLPPRPGEEPRRQPSGSRRKKSHSQGLSIDPGSLIKPLLVVAIIAVLLFIIVMIRPSKDSATQTTAPSVTETTPEASSKEEDESENQTTSAAVLYKTVDTVNVRPEPSTDSDRIGLLGPDTQVEYVKDHDEKWCVIKYNGQDAYVAKEFVTPIN